MAGDDRKTQLTGVDVDEFLAGIEHETRRADALVIRDLMAEVTGDSPEMWGPTIVGYGRRNLTYASGKEQEWFDVGFSPRKANTTLYIMDGFDAYDEMLGRLGKHKIGKSCLYVTRLANVDMDVLRDLVQASVNHIRSSE